MPDFFDVARSQRGISHFKPDPIPAETLHQILEAATRAPSGSNRQPWRFVVVQDSDVKRKLGELYLEGQRRSRGSAPPPRPEGEPPLFTHGMADVPVVVLSCAEKWQITGRRSLPGRLHLSGGAEPDARRSGPRHWLQDHDDLAALLRRGRGALGRAGGLGHHGADPPGLSSGARPSGRQPSQARLGSRV